MSTSPLTATEERLLEAAADQIRTTIYIVGEQSSPWLAISAVATALFTIGQEQDMLADLGATRRAIATQMEHAAATGKIDPTITIIPPVLQ